MVYALTLGCTNNVTPYERKFNDKVFQDCQKRVKCTEVRDADWGLFAAQTCLARDLVTASKEEAGLIVAKMNFLQNIINQNMEQDQDIFTRETNDKVHILTAKADAKARVIPARAQAIKTTADAASELIDSTSTLADSSLKVIREVKQPKLNLVA